jgi:polysaccharide deacetylase family protein (PEP-CTERM system associated)
VAIIWDKSIQNIEAYTLKNIFTVDVEEFYHLNFPSLRRLSGQLPDGQIVKNVHDLLAVCARYGAQATFFFLGSVAEQYPELVRLVQAEGHEIASHGYGHQLVYQQSRIEFYEDVKKSINILQNITGLAVKGYRAPSWSISTATPWAYEVLLELDIKYDASLFPFRTFLYGDGLAPVNPYVRLIDGRRLYEVPATVLEILGLRVPFGGGFYFRFFPYWMTRLATHFVNRQERPVIFYLHPREIDQTQPRLSLPLRDYFISYINLSGTFNKLERILKSNSTVGVYQYLELTGLLDDNKNDT